MGEVSPAAILDAPPPSPLGDLARELARIHAVPLEKVPAAIPLMDTGAALAALKARFLSYGGDTAALAPALKWSAVPLPYPARTVPVAGPYRMAKLLEPDTGVVRERVCT